MKKALSAVVLCLAFGLLAVSAFAQGMPLQPALSVQSSKAAFNFTGINVSQVIQLIYGEVLKADYVLDPEVLTDQRSVSFRYSQAKGEIRPFVAAFLASLGYSVETRGAVDYITKTRQSDKPEPETGVFIYRPKYREVSYIARLLSPMFKGSFTVNRAVAAPEGSKVKTNAPEGSAAATIDQSADSLIFVGTDKEIKKLEGFLPQVDFAIGEVVVRGVVYEVSTSDKDGSAFGLLATLLGGKLNIGFGGAANLGNFLKIKSINLDAIYSAVSTDSRFKVVSSPSLRIRSGSLGSFSVGQDVPVLGAISYPSGAGQAVQSVEYRSSGVLFDINPTVRDAIIDLTINQQLSNFVTTTTGVNGSPTLTKRSLKTSVSMQDGDLIVLGGLTENKESASHDGLSLLPKFLHSKGAENSRSEILLVLQVQRI